jgi:oligoendopeptidase F
MLNTVVRQIAFCEFERKVHDMRKLKELTTNEISDIWMSTQRESLGEHVDLDDRYKNYWSYIPHFIHSPFYVYSYAFGDCLVNSLYYVYQSNKVDNFESKYYDLLQAAGTKHHSEALKPFGLDASNRDFWQHGINIIIDLIDQVEQL